MRDLFQKIIAQRAANAAIGHFDKLLLGAGKISPALADKGSVNIDLAHIVDDHRHTAVFPDC